MRALLVEDEIHVLMGLRSVIPWEELGFQEVLTAPNGREGLRLFTESSPELIITDVYMPNMNGLELIERIREVDRDVPIIILSGHDDFEYAREAIRYNVSHYILKPAVHTEVVNVLRSVMEERDASRRKEKMLEELQQRLQSHLPALREQFVFDMFTAGKKSSELLASELEFYRLDASVGEGALAGSIQLHRPRNNPKTNEERDWQLLKFAVTNIAQEIAVPNGGFVLRFIEDRLPVVMFGSDKRSITQKATETLQWIIRYIEQYLDLSANAGLGRWYRDVQRYPLSMKESSAALQAVDSEGYQKVFSIEETEKLLHGEHGGLYPAEQIRLLSAAFVKADRAQVESLWHSMKQSCLQSPILPASFAKTVASGIVIQTMSAMLEHGAGMPESEEMIPFLEQIQNMSSASEVVEAVEDRLFGWVRRMELQFDGQGQRGYVNLVLEKIRNGYHENLTFHEIAKSLHLSRTYLSNVFKTHTGVSFMHYLTHYRIEKAKELMSRRQYMVYEISEMVGYSDPSYFCRVFKNVVGLTPSEYMNKE